MRALAPAFVALALALGAAGAAADEEADFYRGKSIRVVVGGGAGDSFDLYARLVSRHIGGHLPGKPTIVVQNMPGAGSLTAFGYVLNAAPRDGTVIGMINPVVTIQPLLQPDVVKIDPRAIDWLGSLAGDHYTCGFWGPERLTLDDLRSRETVVGSPATTSATYAGNQVFMRTLGLKLRIVLGYGSMNQLNLAAEKGEVRGHCGVMATSIKSSLFPFYSSGRLKIAVQAALRPGSALDGVPNAFDLVTREEDRQTLLLLAGPWTYGRPLFAPQGLPPARLANLRAAFEAMVRDAVFLKEASDVRADIEPLTGAEVVREIRRIHEIPAAVLERARPMFGIEK